MPQIHAEVGCLRIACLKGFSHPPVRVRTPVGAGQIEFVHQTPNLFEIHDHRRIHMKQGHVDALGTFCIAVHFVGIEYQIKVITVLLFFKFSCRGGFDPSVITAAGHTCHFTERLDRHGVMALLHGVVDDFKYTGRIVHEQCTYFPVVLIEEIFFEIPFPVSGNLLHAGAI